MIVDTDKLDPLFCSRHDSEYKWSGEFTEKKCKDKDCPYCKKRPENIDIVYCNKCPLREGCISFNARVLGRSSDNVKNANEVKDGKL